PGIARIVEGAGVDERPVQEISLRIGGVFVGIEYVDGGEFSDGQHQTAVRRRTGKLIDVGIDLPAVATEIDRLPHEVALHARIRIRSAELVGLAAGKAGDAVGIAEPESLVEFEIGPEFGAVP